MQNDFTEPKLRAVGWEPYQGRRTLRKLPRLLGESCVLLWQAAPGVTLALVVLQVLGALALAGTLLALQNVIETVATAAQGTGPAILVPGVAVLAGALFVAALAQLLQGSLSLVLTERVTWNAFEKLLDVATAADLAAFDTPAFHDRLNRAQNAGGRPLLITQSLIGIGGSLTSLLSLVGVLLALHPLLVAPLILMVIPLVAASSSFSGRFYDFATAFNEAERRRYYLRALLTNRETAKEVRAYGFASYIRNLGNQIMAARLHELRRLVTRSVPFAFLSSAGAGLAVATSVGLLLALVLAQEVSFATAATAAVTVLQVASVLTTLALSVGQLYESSLFLDDYRMFLNRLPELRRARPTAPAPRCFREIRVTDVTFRYPENERKALDGVSLRLERGQIVALVGENGSGKSTLAKLLCGLYQPESGRIYWDSTLLTDVDGDELRQSIAVIFQDFGRYLFSVAENIGLGRVEQLENREGIVRAAKITSADDFIEELPRGYDTLLGQIFEQGTDLSVGQWQRIALARAFFRDAELIILDEPTASLDARAEHELFASMRSLFAGRTVLLISHRFSTVQFADQIYVLDKGRIAESGTHLALTAANGLYAELFNLQAAAYRTAPN